MVANASAVQGFEFDRVIGAEEATEPRRRALPRQAMIGLGLMAGGLLGVTLAVVGAVALFSATKPAAGSITVEDLAAQLADLSQSVKWTGDAVEQIADYLNELAGQNEVDASRRPH